MADNPLLELYGTPPGAKPPIDPQPKSNPLIDLYSGPSGQGQPVQRPELEMEGRHSNPLASLYSAQPELQKHPFQPEMPKDTMPSTEFFGSPQMMGKLASNVAGEPERIARGMVETVKAPGEIMASKTPVSTEQMIEPAANIAMLTMGGRDPFAKPKDSVASIGGAGPMEGAKALKNLLSPSSTPLGRESGLGLRKATGESAQSVEISRYALLEHDKQIAALPPQGQLDLLGYIEGRSKGRAIPNPGLQAYADEFRTQMEKRVGMIKNAGLQAGVIEDFVSHAGLWQDPKAANSFIKSWAAKQGSGAALKQRTIPTIEEGIRAGLTPNTTNPTELGIRYITSMDRHIALHEMLNAGETAGHVKYIPLKDIPKSVPDGWMPLGGMADKVGTKGYAPADWARIWNNFVSKGFHGNMDASNALTAFRNLSNLTTQSILGLSGYHAMAMSKEAIASDIVKGIGQVVGGLRRLEATQVLRGGGTIAKSPVAFVTKARTGAKLRDVYLGRTPNSIDPRQLPNWKKLASIYAEAGGRAVGKEHAFDYSFTPAGNFSTAWKRGWLKAEMRQAPGTFSKAFRDEAQKVIQAGGNRQMAAKAGAKAMQTARSISEIFSRTMSTVMAPLFEKYIPLLKNGAFADEMKSWMELNPQATHEQQIAFAAKLIDSIDNRFGEMIQDNIMWHTSLKQAATIGMLSYSWNLGSFRLMAGGGKDIARSFGRAFDPTSKHYSPNAAWIIAYPMAVAIGSAVYQFLKTGKPPESPKDLIFPQAGGTAPGFGQRGKVPQLAILPGYEKEPFGWFYNGANEVVNKANPFLRMGYQAIMNTDWKGDAIRPPDPTVPEWFSETFNYALKSLVPITLGRMGQGEAPGSAMGLPEQLLGIRPAPIYEQDPKGYAKGMGAIETQKWQKKLRFDLKHGLITQQEYSAKLRAAKDRQSKYGGPQQ